jgi:hypothetical protein
LQHKQHLHLDTATVLVFRDKRVYRLEHHDPPTPNGTASKIFDGWGAL